MTSGRILIITNGKYTHDQLVVIEVYSVAAEKTISDDPIDANPVYIREQGIIIHMKIEVLGGDTW